MRRATTPVHKFTFPVDPATFEKILITYSQGRRVVLEKTKDDLTFEDYVGRCKLTQEEANLFKASEPLLIQVRVLTYAGNALASEVFKTTVKEVLDDAILESD